jgi:hypothetical protein
MLARNYPTTSGERGIEYLAVVPNVVAESYGDPSYYAPAKITGP